MEGDVEIINTKQLRGDLAGVVRRARAGKRFLVLHRSKPAFELVPPPGASEDLPPLEKDSIFQMPALGRTSDAMTSRDHDRILYGR